MAAGAAFRVHSAGSPVGSGFEWTLMAADAALTVHSPGALGHSRLPDAQARLNHARHAAPATMQ
jgi:hypothetical protein